MPSGGDERRAWDALIWFAPLLMMADTLNESGVIKVLSSDLFAHLQGLSWTLAFPAIAAVGFWIGEMLRAIEFYNDTQRLVKEIDLHLTLAIERNGNPNVQLETAFCLGKSFKAPI